MKKAEERSSNRELGEMTAIKNLLSLIFGDSESKSSELDLCDFARIQLAFEGSAWC